MMKVSFRPEADTRWNGAECLLYQESGHFKALICILLSILNAIIEDLLFY